MNKQDDCALNIDYRATDIHLALAYFCAYLC